METIMTNRRAVLKGAALGLGALAAPAIISKRALASSGALNFTGWAGYPALTKTVIPAFEKASGIKVNFTELPDLESMFAKAKLSLQTGAIDVIEPTLDVISAWNANGLLRGWDTNKLAMDNYITGLADGDVGKRATIDGKRLLVPSVWGTESLLVDPKTAVLGDRPSLGALFDPGNQVTLRPHSALAAMGRWLDAQGKLPRPWMDGYQDMAVMEELWTITLDAAIKAKGNVVQWWSGENEANAGFTVNGATVGLCWDVTAFNLQKDAYKYLAPSEGAFAWNQGVVLMSNAVNVDEAHEFAKWLSSAEGSALWASAFSSNPVGKGGIDKMDPAVSAFFKATFDDEALKKLWWWPDQSAQFLAKRSEFADKYRAA